MYVYIYVYIYIQTWLHMYAHAFLYHVAEFTAEIYKMVIQTFKIPHSSRNMPFGQRAKGELGAAVSGPDDNHGMTRKW